MDQEMATCLADLAEDERGVFKKFAGELQKHGLWDPRYLSPLNFEGAKSLFESAMGGEVQCTENLERAVDKLLKAAAREADWTDRLNRPLCDPRIDDVITVETRNAKRRKQEEETGGGPGGSFGVGSSTVRVRATWSATRAAVTKQLAEIDEGQMEKWAGRAVKILEEAGTPSWIYASSADNPPLVVRGLLGKARASTIRLRVRSWEAFSRWLWLRRGRLWPTCVLDILEYVTERMAEAPVATFPKAFGAALLWFEARAGVPEEQKFGKNDLVRRLLEKASVDAGAGLVRVARAPRFPLCVLASLEVMVCDTLVPMGLRVVAWTRLLKTYGVLRSDDLQRLRPSEVSFGEAGFQGRLTRTKISGPGKALPELRVFVPCSAFVAVAEWLPTGYALWEKGVARTLDFFLPRLCKSMENLRRGWLRAAT